MPGIDKILRGILKYHATMKNDMLKQLKMVKDNPQVSLKACSFTSVVKTLMFVKVVQFGASVKGRFKMRGCGVTSELHSFTQQRYLSVTAGGNSGRCQLERFWN